MARTKAFDPELVLDAAISVFREHGFDGTSADMLVGAMGIGRQSLYDTFGDKWRLYQAALQRYNVLEGHAHIASLREPARAIDGLRAMMERVVETARSACLGVGAICEFGSSKPEIAKINAAADRVLRAAIIERVREAQADGDVTLDLQPGEVVDFLFAAFAGIRVAARGGADAVRLEALGRTALRALY